MENKATPNRLAYASSPYLRAHAANPVDWYEWGDEAFARAAAEDKPIFLSIGYNACHWCHVMAHESFENNEIADILNRYYVSIKVDREERPDIDRIYMSAVQAMTGSGGWPMSVFMMPDRKPFFAGTYFPPDSKYGRPGFKDILIQLARGYREERKEIIRSADAIVEHISVNSTAHIPGRPIDVNVIASAAKVLHAHFDKRFGGFGGAPKFPQAAGLSFMLRAAHLTGQPKYAEAVLFTLKKMADGGIHDQIGGGFHRYSVDHKWFAPHFEKMLYDNALLAIVYLEAYQYSGHSHHLDIVDDILKYLQAEMTDASGGFYSSQDADSEGEEGKYYTWTKAEIERILGPEGDWICRYFGATEAGNFEGGRNILHVSDDSGQVRQRLNLRDHEFGAKLAELKRRLLTERQKRIAPAIDDKILASWNGLAISAFAQAYQATGNDSYFASAKNAADFVLSQMTDKDILYHSFCRERLLRTELLEDYAYFVAGLLDLYQASFDEIYLNHANSLTRRAVIAFFMDDTFYTSTADNVDLIFRPRELTDGATPSPGSVMILNLLRLSGITSDGTWADIADRALAALSGLAAQAPQGSAALLSAGYFRFAEPLEIVVSGKGNDRVKEFNKVVFSRFIPNKIVVGSIDGIPSNLPLLQGRQNTEALTYYFCFQKTCGLPITDKSALVEELDRVTGSTT